MSHHDYSSKQPIHQTLLLSEACATRLCSHACSVGLTLEPWDGCDVINVNSAPDESGKESSYFHVHGSHL